jgi:mRNA-degrading endonuclease toxin of MazEF toxin-antitoxin module
MSSPQRGEIWFTKLPTDPPEKGKRPVVIVSVSGRNNHPRAETVLVVPLSTSVHKGDVFTHLVLEPGQTGLRERVVARAEDITTVRKVSVDPAHERLRVLTSYQVCELAQKVKLAMECEK